MDKKENLSHAQMLALRSQIKKANEEKRLESCRKRLDTIISTKIRTAFIGSIAHFEDSFGFLWGHGRDLGSLTDEEKQMRELWDQTRTSILNSGNNQLRAAQNEIQLHVVSWNRHHIDLVVKPKEEEDNA
jgi:hypothetical protein